MPTVPGAFTAGDVLAAADMNALPGGFIAYAQRGANQGLADSASVQDLSNLEVTFTALASRRYKITGHAGMASVNNAARWIGLVRKGSTTIGRFGQIIGYDSGNNATGMLDGCIVDSPSAGSVTYKLSVERISGTGSATSAAAAENPAFILVEDIGPA
jgi:hypothetical protein